MSSLENVGNESILFIAFANTFIAKNDTNPNPTVWVGTSCGSVIVIALTMPDNVDNRVLCLQTVLATPTPSIYRLKGSILNIGFLDSFGQQLSLKPDHWKDQTRADSSTPTSDGKRQTSLSITRSGSASAGGGTGVGSFSNNSGSSNLKSSTSGDGVGGSGSGGGASGSNSNSGKISKISPTTSSSDFRDSHLVVITSEKQIRLIALPLQVCVQKATITETSFAVRADVVYMKNQGESRDQTALCLACYLGTGNIVVYSLPSLRQLIDVDFVPLTDVRIARTIFFSANGHAMYMSSPSEVTKFTISSSIMETLSEMTESAFTESKPLPEQPKQSFLKGLFGGAPTPLDREELFGEASSGKASKTTARLIPGSIDHAKAHTSAIGGEFAKLREGFNERGERLGKLEDSTARMQNEAEVFSSAAHAVMLKYRDKKWYQF
ncbi:hypothetical protein RDWZM_010317 [Blomia tropicalis]|uniref:V-SNARE coiled-coil homology domain-containing protein n=1 Tax=Blomia tropicalis TaxID=40697 RepID=A0A9Q0M0R9_BLOTA|nr:hypothetical protein RDWZM_010317 [Blomia tropicalis]